jgi:hypothetical protein
MTEYKLVNPVIIGTFDSKFNAPSAENAAKNFWEKLTENGKYISGNVPSFLFTLMETKNNALHHFKVQELPDGKFAEYTIDKIDVKLTKTQKDKFLNGVKDVVSTHTVLSGGKKKRRRRDKDDSSSSSSSSSSSDDDDLFRYLRVKSIPTPISYWWYAPTIYNVPKIFNPTFVAPVSPYVQLWIPV